jgi:V8-like Glu-specific endopeptidase
VRYRRLLHAAAGVAVFIGIGAFVTSATGSVYAQSLSGRLASKTGLDPTLTVETMATVGPLFSSERALDHTCTAAVVDSPGGNTLLTAAHCVTGTGEGMVFAPGYANGIAPYGTWVVQRVYADPAWTLTTDPEDDWVFLVVAPAKSNPTADSVQAIVGGNTLGVSTGTGESVTVAGYLSGQDDQPVVCTATVYETAGYPSFDCAGYSGGTSGSPWIVNYNSSTGSGEIVAVIGGLNQGGCTPDTSYSSPLGPNAQASLARAATQSRGDLLPAAGGDGC